jgi:hypothetical protein
VYKNFVPIFYGTDIENMIIILDDQTTTYNCRSISRTAAAQAIKYEVSPIKLAATTLIDESGLQESNSRT